MENYDEESEHDEHYGHTIRGFLAGVLIGGLAGAGTMLLMAPQSGQRTRTQIRRTGVALRDQAMDSVEDAMDQARETSQQITANVHKQADKLQQKAEKNPAARPRGPRRAKRALGSGRRSRQERGQRLISLAAGSAGRPAMADPAAGNAVTAGRAFCRSQNGAADTAFPAPIPRLSVNGTPCESRVIYPGHYSRKRRSQWQPSQSMSW
jgi:gas vesicle protein